MNANRPHCADAEAHLVRSTAAASDSRQSLRRQIRADLLAGDVSMRASATTSGLVITLEQVVAGIEQRPALPDPADANGTSPEVRR